MLSILGESPVNTLNPPYGVDVANARNQLYDASKSVQAEGWAFNSEENYSLAPNASGNIVVPENLLSVDADTETAFDIVLRGTMLYDKKAHSLVFTRALKCEVIWMFAFDELPECARLYIKIKAARAFQARFLGSDSIQKFTELDESRARVTLMSEEGRTGDTNILNDPALAYITRRGNPRRGR
jgi:hypothetical protein